VEIQESRLMILTGKDQELACPTMEALETFLEVVEEEN
jgi:hypothetical protein